MLTNSGGQDSTVLFLLILILQSQFKYSLVNIYCNHLWQRSSLQLIIHLSRIHFHFEIELIVMTPSKFSKLMNENISRNWRYNTLARLGFFSSFEYTMVAHTSTDQIESFFLNICRGSGSVGLTTLKTERINFFIKFICFTDKKIKISKLIFLSVKQKNARNFFGSLIWRPLFLLNRYEIHNIYKELILPIWTDKTNLNLNYRRNRIRFELLPYLRFYFNSNVDIAILRCIQNISSQAKYLKKITYKAFKTSLIFGLEKKIIIHDFSQFNQYPLNIQKSIIIESFMEFNEKLSSSNTIQYIFKLIFIIKQNPLQKNDKPQLFFLSKKLLIGFYWNFFYICTLK